MSREANTLPEENETPGYKFLLSYALKPTGLSHYHYYLVSYLLRKEEFTEKMQAHVITGMKIDFALSVKYAESSFYSLLLSILNGLSGDLPGHEANENLDHYQRNIAVHNHAISRSAVQEQKNNMAFPALSSYDCTDKQRTALTLESLIKKLKPTNENTQLGANDLIHFWDQTAQEQANENLSSFLEEQFQLFINDRINSIRLGEEITTEAAETLKPIFDDMKKKVIEKMQAELTNLANLAEPNITTIKKAIHEKYKAADSEFNALCTKQIELTEKVKAEYEAEIEETKKAKANAQPHAAHPESPPQFTMTPRLRRRPNPTYYQALPETTGNAGSAFNASCRDKTGSVESVKAEHADGSDAPSNPTMKPRALFGPSSTDPQDQRGISDESVPSQPAPPATPPKHNQSQASAVFTPIPRPRTIKQFEAVADYSCDPIQNGLFQAALNSGNADFVVICLAKEKSEENLLVSEIIEADIKSLKKAWTKKGSEFLNVERPLLIQIIARAKPYPKKEWVFKKISALYQKKLQEVKDTAEKKIKSRAPQFCNSTMLEVNTIEETSPTSPILTNLISENTPRSSSAPFFSPSPASTNAFPQNSFRSYSPPLQSTPLNQTIPPIASLADDNQKAPHDEGAFNNINLPVIHLLARDNNYPCALESLAIQRDETYRSMRSCELTTMILEQLFFGVQEYIHNQIRRSFRQNRKALYKEKLDILKGSVTSMIIHATYNNYEDMLKTYEALLNNNKLNQYTGIKRFGKTKTRAYLEKIRENVVELKNEVEEIQDKQKVYSEQRKSPDNSTETMVHFAKNDINEIIGSINTTVSVLREDKNASMQSLCADIGPSNENTVPYVLDITNHQFKNTTLIQKRRPKTEALFSDLLKHVQKELDKCKDSDKPLLKERKSAVLQAMNDVNAGKDPNDVLNSLITNKDDITPPLSKHRSSIWKRGDTRSARKVREAQKSAVLEEIQKLSCAG